jgi:hypothetical protein
VTSLPTVPVCKTHPVRVRLNYSPTTIVSQSHMSTMKLFSILALIPAATAFVVQPNAVFELSSRTTTSLAAAAEEPFEISVLIPPAGSGMQADMKIPKMLSVPSEIVEVRYKVPFGLDVAPKKNFAVCTKDGAGGEKVGDILRYTSMWSIGLPRGDGILSTAASFSGGVSWQCSLFNVMKANSWEEVVEALTSNVEVRT